MQLRTALGRPAETGAFTANAIYPFGVRQIGFMTG